MTNKLRKNFLNVFFSLTGNLTKILGFFRQENSYNSFTLKLKYSIPSFNRYISKNIREYSTSCKTYKLNS